MIIAALSKACASDLRGNLNLSYQGADASSGVSTSSTFSQVANFYTNDRLFYGNDMTLGAFILHSKVSGRARDEFRVRYSFNLFGRGFNLYTSYSPYTLYRPSGSGQKFRVFQSSLTVRPAKMPEILASYASTRQFTTDRSQSGLNQSWNIGTQFARAFGAFRGVYQRQQTRSDQALQSQKQATETVSLGYNISKSLPAKIGQRGPTSLMDNVPTAPIQQPK